MSNEPPQALLCNADGPINGHAIAGLEAALSAQAAEIARLRDALKIAEDALEEIGESHDAPQNDSTARSALAQIREARKP